MKNGISIVIPAYNEEEGIIGFLTRLAKALEAIGRPFEIVVADDGSTDDTVEKLQEFKKRNNCLKIVQLGQNRGIGAAIASGFKAAEMPLVGYTDADEQFDSVLWGAAIDLLEEKNADMLCGRRFNRGCEGFMRQVYSVGFNILVGPSLNIKLHDINAAFKIVKRSFLEKFELISERSLIDAELIDKVQRRGGKIIEFPYVLHKREAGSTKLGNMGNVVNTFADFFKYKFVIRKKDLVD